MNLVKVFYEYQTLWGDRFRAIDAVILTKNDELALLEQLILFNEVHFHLQIYMVVMHIWVII